MFHMCITTGCVFHNTMKYCDFKIKNVSRDNSQNRSCDQVNNAIKNTTISSNTDFGIVSLLKLSET